MAAGATPLGSGGRIGKYRIVRLLGGDDRVLRYLAEHTGIGRAVELHCLSAEASADGEAAAQLVREARAFGGASSRNLQGVVDTGRDPEGRPYVVFEALRGEPLSALTRAHPRGLAPERAARIAMQILEALRVLHDAGVVLRRLGPHEVTVEPVSAGEDLVKLRSVHGAALLIEGGAEPVEVGGYAAYVAPEVRRGDPGLDPRVDLYAAGALFRQLLTGAPRGDDEMLSDTARRALARACAEDPDERFASAEGFLQAVALMLPAEDRPPREQLPVPEDSLQADLQYLHLRRTTRHGPRSELEGDSRLSLLPVLLTIEAIYRRFGAEVWEELSRRVEGAEALLPGAGNTPVHLEKGVPVPLFAEILAVTDRIAGRGDLSLVAELGEAMAQRGLHRLFPKLPRPLTPDAIVDGFAYLWSRIGRDGRARVHRTSERSARLSIQDQTTPSLELAGLLAGLLRDALRQAGAEDVEVLLIGAQALGDGRDLFGVEWRPARSV
jgi:serine/threonine-protein kinase